MYQRDAALRKVHVGSMAQCSRVLAGWCWSTSLSGDGNCPSLQSSAAATDDDCVGKLHSTRQAANLYFSVEMTTLNNSTVTTASSITLIDARCTRQTDVRRASSLNAPTLGAEL